MKMRMLSDERLAGLLDSMVALHKTLTSERDLARANVSKARETLETLEDAVTRVETAMRALTVTAPEAEGT